MQEREAENFELGPSFHFMKCRKLYLKESHKITRFLLQIKTRT